MLANDRGRDATPRLIWRFTVYGMEERLRAVRHRLGLLPPMPGQLSSLADRPSRPGRPDNPQSTVPCHSASWLWMLKCRLDYLRALSDRGKPLPELAVVVADQVSRAFAPSSGLPQLLCNPLIAR